MIYALILCSLSTSSLSVKMTAVKTYLHPRDIARKTFVEKDLLAWTEANGYKKGKKNKEKDKIQDRHKYI
jgi:hypothetical protein